MKPAAIRLDLATAVRPAPRGARLLLAAGVVLLGVALWQSGQIVAERTRALAGLRALEAERVHADTPPPSAKPDQRQLALARTTRQVTANLNTPWSGLLTALGSSARKDVALLAVEPSAAKRSVRLTAEARDDDEMIAYLATLQSDPRLKAVFLASHQVQTQAPGTPVRFQIQALWGDAP
jgi:Tfp pilus assembly protein PilN